MSKEAIHALFGPGESIIFGRAFPDRLADVMRDYLDCYTRAHSGLTLDAAIRDLVAELAGRHVRLGIVTNKERDTTAITLAHFGLSDWFGVVVTAEDVPAPKPAPDGIRLALSQLGHREGPVLLIGDTLNDVRAAKAAGIDIVQALWFVPPDERTGRPAWPVAETVDAARAIILGTGTRSETVAESADGRD